MRVKTTLREALTDKRLLGKTLAGPSWHTWRTILLAAMGEPLTPKELVTYRQVTGRMTAPTQRCEELVGIVGRRGGKSRAVAVLATYLATLIDYKDVLVPGERGLLLCVAPDMEQAKVVHGYIAGAIAKSEVLRPLLKSSTRNTLRLSNGIDIVVRSASWRRLRGVTCIAAIADESCFWFGEESSANRDEEILQAVRPTLATTHGLLAIISTPYARHGATWEAFSRDYGPQGDPHILVATGTSLTFNPSLDKRIVDRAYERDPIAAAAEFGAQWRTDISAFFSREAVMACVDPGVMERPYCTGTAYSAFVDPSGGSADSMTLAISHKQKDGTPVLDLIREVRPPFAPENVVAEFCETLKAYRCNRVVGDRYAGEWPREQFAKRGVKFDHSDRSATGLFLELLPLINAGQASLLEHRRLIDQLIGLERRTMFGTGRDTVGHPRNAHDDIAVAAAGAILLATAKKPRIRQGCVDLHGRVHWKDDEERPPLRIVHVDENGNPLPKRDGGVWA
jgi:hypothetical protein